MRKCSRKRGKVGLSCVIWTPPLNPRATSKKIQLTFCGTVHVFWFHCMMIDEWHPQLIYDKRDISQPLFFLGQNVLFSCALSSCFSLDREGQGGLMGCDCVPFIWWITSGILMRADFTPKGPLRIVSFATEYLGFIRKHTARTTISVELVLGRITPSNL